MAVSAAQKIATERLGLTVVGKRSRSALEYDADVVQDRESKEGSNAEEESGYTGIHVEVWALSCEGTAVKCYIIP